MAKKHEMPPYAFIGGKNKVKHKHVVFKIVAEDKDGTPRLCRLLHDHESTQIDGGEKFMTAYVPAHMIDGEEASGS